MKKLDTIIGEEKKFVEISNNNIIIDSKQFTVSPADIYCFEINSNSKTLKVEDIIPIDSSNFRVEIEGFTIDVRVIDPISSAIIDEEASMGDVYAPMAGQISKIFVLENEKVSKGDTLVVISAMKMENQILAPTDGIVKCINVSVDDQVEVAQLLIELERVIQ